MEAAKLSNELSQGAILEWLEPIVDPDLGMSLVGMGLIYNVYIHEVHVDVEMTLTSPGCPVADVLVQNVKDRLLEHEKIESAEVSLVWEPKWNPSEMASEEVKEQMGIW